jgi:hypothetical protein
LNYQKIYDDICKRGQERQLPKETYTEKHHIVPKCLGGTNEKSNLTVLTAREHFLVHLILARKLHPKNPKLWTALHYMLNLKTRRSKSFVKSSKEYESLRIEVNRNLKGQLRSQEIKDKISNGRKGIPMNPDYVIRMTETHWRAKKVQHLETGLVFNSGAQACSYFGISKDILKTKLKHGIFKIIPKDDQKMTHETFIFWLKNYLIEFRTNLDVELIENMIEKIKNNNLTKN